MRVLAISGSVRRDSTNTALLRAAAEEAPERVDVVLWQGLKEIPPYDQDDDVIPGPPADAVDWASRPLATNVFRSKPVAVIGASSGMFGAVWSQAELRKILGQAMGAQVADVEVAVGRAFEKLDEEGRLVDEDVRAQLRDVMAVLTEVQEQQLVAA